jgi:SAM-dependent methyltransferase
MPEFDPRPLVEESVRWAFYSDTHEIDKTIRRVEQFLIPVLQGLDANRILEVGCGSGYGTVHLHERGFDAWGVDPHFINEVESVYPFLRRGSGDALPFEDESFDVSLALEVIEHVGTTDGMLELAEDFASKREAFVAEMCRVSRSHVIIATPNKRFPVDEHAADRHGRHGFRIHSPFERATLSVRELDRMFGRSDFRLDRFLDPSGYFALERIERKLGTFGAAAARALLRLAGRGPLARSFLNPHLFLLFARAGERGRFPSRGEGRRVRV